MKHPFGFAIERSRLLGPQLVANIMQENRDLYRIFTSSLKTARVGNKMTNEKWKMENDLGARRFRQANLIYLFPAAPRLC